MSLEGFAERVKVEGLRDSEVEGMEAIRLYHLKQNIKRRREETRWEETKTAWGKKEQREKRIKYKREEMRRTAREEKEKMMREEEQQKEMMQRAQVWAAAVAVERGWTNWAVVGLVWRRAVEEERRQKEAMQEAERRKRKNIVMVELD